MINNSSNPDDFSISSGGPFNNALDKVHLRNNPKKLTVVILCLVWLPLFVITAIEGTLYSGVDMPFLKDIGMQGRILLALPLLILIRLSIDNKVALVIKYISESLMKFEEQRLILRKEIYRASKLTSSAITEIILLLIVIAVTISFVKGGLFVGLEGEKTSWITTMQNENRTLSFSGYWVFIISIPMIQFLLIRWAWRYCVWIFFLYRLSKTELNLMPTHVDKSGGLGIILLAQKSFLLIFITISVIIASQVTAMLIESPELFETLRSEVVAFIILSILLIVFPLLFFTIRLVKLKNEGLMNLTDLGVKMSREFEQEWIKNLSDKKQIEEKLVDPSMIIDYSGMFESLNQLRVVPVTPRDIIGMAVILFVPFIPSLFIHYSVGELVQRIGGLLM